MAAPASAAARLRAGLRLGRVSNLPTVWTNVLAASVLAGGGVGPVVGPLLLAGTLFYTGGMYLNDAFDRRFDAGRYPDRPVPQGVVSTTIVFTLGGLQLAAGVAIAVVVAVGRPQVSLVAGPALALLLAAAIVYYDAHHKANPAAPFVMALCRALVYAVTATLVTAVVPGRLWLGAGLMAAYVLGLTYVARIEQAGRGPLVASVALLGLPVVYAVSRLGDGWAAIGTGACFVGWVGITVVAASRRRASGLGPVVPRLIAGISLLDAVLIAGAGGHATLAGLAVGGAVVTLAAQRWIPGS